MSLPNVAPGITTFYANQLLDLILGTVGLLPANVYIGLLKTIPNPDGSGAIEVSGGVGYARQAVANNATQWPAASARVKTHANDIVFPSASGAWGTVLAAAVFDASSGGNIALYTPLDVPRTVNPGDVFRFLAGSSPLSFGVPAIFTNGAV